MHCHKLLSGAFRAGCHASETPWLGQQGSSRACAISVTSAAASSYMLRTPTVRSTLVTKAAASWCSVDVGISCMLLRFWVTLPLIVRGVSSLQNESCFLHTEPGFWTVEGHWIPSDESCTFHNLAGGREATRDLPAEGVVSILLFGDSNDNHILDDFCLWEAPHAHGVDVFGSCFHSTWSVSYQAMVRDTRP